MSARHSGEKWAQADRDQRIAAFECGAGTVPACGWGPHGGSALPLGGAPSVHHVGESDLHGSP
jgi:hypothetical protein